MAVIWAKKTGSWNVVTDDGHIWMWHNPDTNTNEEYIVDGVRKLPGVGDTVYCNGYTITYTGGIDLGNGWLRNDPNEDYGIVGGGRINYGANAGMSITANCYAHESVLIYSYSTSGTATYSITITGNCVAPASASAGVINSNGNTSTGRRYVYVTGNVDCSRGGSLMYNCGLGLFVVTGNVILGDGTFFHLVGNYLNSSTITGKLSCTDGSTGYLCNLFINTSQTLKIGEVDFLNGSPILFAGANAIAHYINITGDLKVSNNVSSQQAASITVGGNVYSNRGYWGAPSANLTVGGTLTQISRSWLGSNSAQTRVNGDIYLLEGARLQTYCATFILGGNLHTAGHNTPLGCVTGTFTVPDDFKVFYEENADPYVHLFSRYQLDNTEEYPAESDVRKDVPYAYGVKKGSLDVNTNIINIYKR